MSIFSTDFTKISLEAGARSLGYDKFVNISNIKGRCQAWRGRHATPPSQLITPNMFVDMLSSDLLYSTDPDLNWFKQKCRKSWIGNQGIPPESNEAADELWKPYYGYKPQIDEIPEAVINVFKEIVGRVMSYPTDAILTNSQLIASGELTRRMGNAGFTYNTRDPQVILQNIGLIASYLHKIESDKIDSLLPELLSYRSMRKKTRGTFNSNAVTSLYQRRYLGSTLNKALLHHPNVKYCSEDTVMQRLFDWYKYTGRKFSNMVAVEGDADGMDTTVTFELADLVVRLVNEVLYPNLTESEKESISKCLFKSFASPLCTMNAELILPVGTHSLFSGQFITNGIECFCSMLAFVWFCYDLDIAVHRQSTQWFRYLALSAFLIVCGDDVAAIMDLPADSDFLALVQEVYAKAYIKLGMKAKKEKQRTSTSSFFFCKNQYPMPGASMPKGWKLNVDTELPIARYPLELALNSAVFPEEELPTNDPGAVMKLTLVRLNNAWGDPQFKTVISRLYTKEKVFDAHSLQIASETTWVVNDWQEKVFGAVTPDISNLPIARYLRTIIK